MTFKIYLNTLDVEQSFIKRENASKWRTYLVRALFICLLALCSFTVAWFFAGARYVPSIQISQKQPDIDNPVRLPVHVTESSLEFGQQIDIDEPLSDTTVLNFDSPPPECQKQKDRLFFLKTHKTASSVIENIIYRYGLSYNKTFAMPNSGGLTYNYKNPFQSKWVMKLPSGEQPDILTQHIRYSNEANELFPISDSYRITIVRDPGFLFPSLFKYFGRLNKPFNEAGSVERFISNPSEFAAKDKQPQFMTRNSLSFQMGFDSFLFNDPTTDQLHEIIDSLDAHFDLVMVADHMSESLILLRHMLCLSFNDIATLSKNKSIRKHIDETLRSKVRSWETVDQPIFKHANETLWKKINDFGIERMQKEVQILNELNDNNRETCVESYKPVNSLSVEFRDYEPPGVKIEGIELKEGYSEVCHSIALSPFALAIDIQDRQCQDSKFLRRFAKLSDRPKNYGFDC